MLCSVLSIYNYVWTNLNLIKFVPYFCVCAAVSFFFFFFFWFLVQMSPTKHLASKKSSERPRIDSDNFISAEADMAYNDCCK